MSALSPPSGFTYVRTAFHSFGFGFRGGVGHPPVEESAAHRTNDPKETYAHKEDYKWPVVILIPIVGSGTLLRLRKARTGHELIEGTLYLTRGHGRRDANFETKSGPIISSTLAI